MRDVDQEMLVINARTTIGVLGDGGGSEGRTIVITSALKIREKSM